EKAAEVWKRAIRLGMMIWAQDLGRNLVDAEIRGRQFSCEVSQESRFHGNRSCQFVLHREVELLGVAGHAISFKVANQRRRTLACRNGPVTVVQSGRGGRYGHSISQKNCRRDVMSRAEEKSGNE